MLGVGIHIHFRPDTTVELDTLRGPDKPRIMVSDYHDASVTIYPGIDGLRRLHESIVAYLAEHDAPAPPPIPADAATDDDDTGEYDTRDIVAALDEADAEQQRAAMFAPPEVP